MAPVFGFVENVFHGVLLDVAGDFDLGVEAGQGVCVGEGVDGPFVHAAEEHAGVETADVFGGEDFDGGGGRVGGGWEEYGPGDVGVKD